MAIIQKNGYGLLKPGRGNDQVKNMIAVDVARSDLNAAHRGDDPKRLSFGGAESNIYPVVRAGSVAFAWLDADQVGLESWSRSAMENDW